MISRYGRIKGFIELIEKLGPFDLYTTMTFPKVTKKTEAMDAYKHFFKYLNRDYKKFYERYVRCLVIFENNISRKGVHIHSFVRGISPDLCEMVLRECKISFGRQCDVQPYAQKRWKNDRYIARKYVSPDLEDFDFLKINSRVRKFGPLNIFSDITGDKCGQRRESN